MISFIAYMKRKWTELDTILPPAQGLRDLMPGSGRLSGYIASSSGFEGLDARLWSFVSLYCLQLGVWGTWCPALVLCQTLLPPAQGLRDLMPGSGPLSDYIAFSLGFEGLDARLWSFVRLYCLQLRVWGTWCISLVLDQTLLPPAQGLRDLIPGSGPLSDFIASSSGFEGLDTRLWSFVRLYCLQLRVWGTWYPALVLCQTLLPPAQGLRDLMPGSGPLSDYIAPSSGFEGLDTRLWSFVRLYCLQLRVWGTWCPALALCQIILPPAQGLRDLIPGSGPLSDFIASSSGFEGLDTRLWSFVRLYCLQLRVWGTWYPALVLCQTLLPPAQGLRDLIPGSGPLSDFIASSSGFEGLDARLWPFVRLYCLQLRVWGTWCQALVLCQTLLPPAQGLRDLMPGSGPLSDYIASSSGFEGLDTRLWSFVRLYCLQLRVWGTWCPALVLCQTLLPPAQGLRDLMPGSGPLSDFIASSSGFEGLDTRLWSFVRLYCLQLRVWGTWYPALVLCQTLLPPAQGLRDLMPGSGPLSDYIASSSGFEGLDTRLWSFVRLYCLQLRVWGTWYPALVLCQTLLPPAQGLRDLMPGSGPLSDYIASSSGFEGLDARLWPFVRLYCLQLRVWGTWCQALVLCQTLLPPAQGLRDLMPGSGPLSDYIASSSGFEGLETLLPPARLWSFVRLYCLQLRVWGTWCPALVLCQTLLPPAQGLRDLMPGSGPLSDFIASSSGFEGLDTRLWSFVRLYCLQLRVWGTWYPALVLCQTLLPPAQGLRDLMPGSGPLSDYIASSSGFEGLDTRLWSFVRLYCLQLRVWGTWCPALALCQIILPPAQGLRDLIPGSGPLSDFIASSSGFEGLDARLWPFVRLYCLQLRVWGTWCPALALCQTILPPAQGLRDLMPGSGPLSDFIASSSGFEGLDARLWSFVRLYCLQLRVWGTWCPALVLCQIILPSARGLRDLMPGSGPLSDYITSSSGFEGLDARLWSFVRLYCLQLGVWGT